MIALSRMNQLFYLTIRNDIIEDLARALIDIGQATEADAKAKAAKEQDELLFNGVATEDHYLFTVEENKRIVGYIWFNDQIRENVRIAYVVYLHIFKKDRGNGYGRNAMNELENTINGMNISTIQSHSLDANTAANSLYYSLGYKPIKNKLNGKIYEKKI